MFTPLFRSAPIRVQRARWHHSRSSLLSRKKTYNRVQERTTCESFRLLNTCCDNTFIFLSHRIIMSYLSYIIYYITFYHIVSYIRQSLSAALDSIPAFSPVQTRSQLHNTAVRVSINHLYPPNGCRSSLRFSKIHHAAFLPAASELKHQTLLLIRP